MEKELLIVGNWKMNLNTSQASLLIHRLQERVRVHRKIEVVLAPSLLTIQPVSLQIDRRKFRLAAQNAFYKDEGAYTGEVSFAMLCDLAHYVIVGHSERRIHLKEDMPTIRDKVAAAIRNGITPILCIGETHNEKHEGHTKRVLHDQLTTALSNLTSKEIRQVVIAYEPVWAISTFQGEVARPYQIDQVFGFLRRQIADLYGEKTARDVRMLYGGSVDETTVRGYLELADCNGTLVGAASLNPYKFAAIIECANKLQKETKNGRERRE